MKTIYSFLISLIAIIYISQAQHICRFPFFPSFPIPETIPDGTRISIVNVFGGEHDNIIYKETEDGYTLLKDSLGFFQYARLNSTGKLYLSGFKARNINERTNKENRFLITIPKHIRNILSDSEIEHIHRNATFSKYFKFTPTKGNIRIPVLLIKYPDLSNTYTKAQLSDHLNNGSGSFKEFLRSSSYGKLNPTFDVFGWYTTPNNYATYGYSLGNTAVIPMVTAAIAQADADVNFSQYDSNKDGYLDALIIIHSGYSAVNALDDYNNYAYPHAGTNALSENRDGILIESYSIQPEKWGTTNQLVNSLLGIPIVTDQLVIKKILGHEFGHLMGVRDLYDVTRSSIGLGAWCIMGHGESYSAYCKEAFGWFNPQVITESATGLVLAPSSSDSTACYRINTQNINEYFLLENKQQTASGPWYASLPGSSDINTSLPGSGLAIYHINSYQVNKGNSNKNNKLVDLEEATGGNELDAPVPSSLGISNALDYLTNSYFGSSGQLFPNGSRTSFNDNTTPNSRTYTNQNTNINVYNIRRSGTNIIFDVTVPPAPPPPPIVLYPNIAFYKPAEWDTSVVISQNYGDNTDVNTFTTEDILYLDISCINNGDTAIANGFSVSIYDIVEDNNEVFLGTLSNNNSVPINGTWGTEDIILGRISEGNHRIKVVINFSLPEKNIADNTFYKNITVTSPENNDEPSNAKMLSVSPTVCTSSGGVRSHNVGRTNSPQPFPFCGGSISNNAGDVWFQVIVPSSGAVDITTYSDGANSSIRNAGMSVYLGSRLESLSSQCFFDANGRMPKLTVKNQRSSDTLFVRLWSYTGERGYFRICVSIPQYTIIALANPSDAQNYVNGGRVYRIGDIVTLSITPIIGYTFQNWTENGREISINTTYSFPADSNRTFIANFIPRRYTLRVTTADTSIGKVGTRLLGSIHSLDTSQLYNYGQTALIRAVASVGYSFQRWQNENIALSFDSDYLLRIDTVSFSSDTIKTLRGLFSISNYPIITKTEPENSGSIDGSGTFVHAQNVILTATPGIGYSFSHWSENGVTLSHTGTLSFSATSSRNIIAHFSVNIYTITTSLNPSSNAGIITNSSRYGTTNYEYLEPVSINASASPGYTFVNWTEPGIGIVSSNPTYIINGATENRNLTANFNRIPYSIVASTNPQNIATIVGINKNTYYYGDTVNFTLAGTTHEYIYDDKIYILQNWTRNGAPISYQRSFSFIVTTNSSLIARFALKTYQVRATANIAEGGNITGTGTFSHGQLIHLNATPSSRYNFSNWTENGIQVSSSPLYSFTVNTDKTLVANFITNSYFIEASTNIPNSGNITGTGLYYKGQTASLTAVPSTGYSFVNWTENGEIVTSTPVFSFTTRSNRNLIANFTQNPRIITATPSPLEAASIQGTGEFKHGSPITITFIPNTGYTFSEWTENEKTVSIDSLYSFIVNTDRNLIAKFSTNLYLVEVSTNPLETGTIVGEKKYPYGRAVAITATPVPGYTFLHWTENGEKISPYNTYSFIISSHRNLVAHFTISTYTITANSNMPNITNITGTGEYKHGDPVELIVTSTSPKHKFIKWMENQNPVSDSAIYQFTAASNRNLTALFDIKTLTVNITKNNNGGNISGSGTYSYNDTVTITATPKNGYKFVHWIENNINVSTNQNYKFNILYDRRLTALFAINPLTKTEFESNSVTIFPNPNTGNFTIDIHNNYTGYIHINIYSLLGESIKKITIHKNNPQLLYNVLLDHLKKGIYIIELQTKNYTITKKVLLH